MLDLDQWSTLTTLSTSERDALVHLWRGTPVRGWPVAVLERGGLLTFRRRYYLFGERAVRLTRRGRALAEAMFAERNRREARDD